MIAGCGGNGGGGTPDAHGTGHDAAIDAPPVAPFGDRMPQIGGGTEVITAPKVMAITYDNDTNRTAYEQFFTQYAASTAWPAQAAEYGVGALTVLNPAHITGNAPGTLTEAQFVAMLTSNTTGASPAWGAADPSTIYQLSIPSGTMYSDSNGSKCCSGYLGYHYSAAIGGQSIPFAINCGGCSGGGLTPLQNLTTTVNHETVEAATDPFNAGFAQTDDDHFAWTFVTGGEAGDLCEYADTANDVSPAGISYTIQRTWSNAAAKAGHDPCVPDVTTPYYQTIPDAPDMTTLSTFGTAITTHVKKIAMGATGTLTLHVYADSASAGPFSITLQDYDAFGSQNYLTITQPTGTYNVGDTVSVPIRVLAADSSLGGNAEVFQVTTTPSSGPSTYFYGLIGQ